MTKDRNAPKRPLTGYMRYIGTIRDEVEKETGLKGIKVTPFLSKRWNALTDEEKSVHNAAFKVEMEAHRIKVTEYRKTPAYAEYLANKKTKKFKKKPKDKNAPKKPQTAYFVMCNEKRNEIKASLENPTMAAVSKKMGEMWKNLSEDERKYYIQKNVEQKERYEREMAIYKETENYKNFQETLRQFQRQKAYAYGKRGGNKN